MIERKEGKKWLIMERELRGRMEPKQEEEQRLGNNNVMEMNEKENEIEQSKVGIMRALVQREDPSAKVLSLSFSFLFLGPVFNYDKFFNLCSRFLHHRHVYFFFLSPVGFCACDNYNDR